MNLIEFPTTFAGWVDALTFGVRHTLSDVLSADTMLSRSATVALVVFVACAVGSLVAPFGTAEALTEEGK